MADLNSIQAKTAALKRINQTGPAVIYVVGIQCVSTWTYLRLMLRKSKRNKEQSRSADAKFVAWFFVFNSIYASLLAYAMWRKWLPSIPGRAFVGLFVGLIGAYLSVWVEYICRVGDKAVTKGVLNSEDGFRGRIWMHATISMILSVAVIALPSA